MEKDALRIILHAMEPKPHKLEFTEEEFKQVRTNAEILYKTIDSVYCPFFGEQVNFNADGLEHLKFKAWNKPRKRNDQFMRLKLLRLAPEVIKNSKTLQGVWDTKKPVRRKRHGKWESLFTDVSYYEFIAVLEKKRMKVIVKQLAGGEKFFWTLIPYWRMDGFNNRVIHDGNPETD